VTQDDLTQPMPHNMQQDDVTIAASYASQPLPYTQETTSPPPPAPYYPQPTTPVQPADPSGQETMPPQDNAYYPQAPATLAQAAGNTNYAAATPPTPPQPSPPQQSKWTRKKLLLLGGAIVLVLFLLGIAGAWLVPTLLAKTNSPVSSTPTAVARKPVARAGVYAPYLARYGPTIRNQIAQGLHLTPAQLATQLRSGKTLSAIATAQGASASQLQTLVTNAFQNGLQPAITNGNLTQQQVNVLIRRMLRQPQALARFLEVLPKANATPVSNQ
jgi:hypothetical protein